MNAGYRYFKKCIVIFYFFLFSTIVNASGIEGNWITYNKKSGKPESIVKIYKTGNFYEGKIIELINPDSKNPLCKKCEGNLKNSPILGLKILSKLMEDGAEYNNGEILDPSNGKVYSLQIELGDSPNELKVRGYFGFSILGHTHVWKRKS